MSSQNAVPCEVDPSFFRCVLSDRYSVSLKQSHKLFFVSSSRSIALSTASTSPFHVFGSLLHFGRDLSESCSYTLLSKAGNYMRNKILFRKEIPGVLTGKHRQASTGGISSFLARSTLGRSSCNHAQSSQL